MMDEMSCSVCGDETRVRHGVNLWRGIWLCPACFTTYEALHEHYKEKGYDEKRCLRILRSIVEKRKTRDLPPDKDQNHTP